MASGNSREGASAGHPICVAEMNLPGKSKQGRHRSGERIKQAIKGGFRPDASFWLDEAWAKHVCGFEGEAKKRVLRTSFHARTGAPPLLKSVGPRFDAANSSGDWGQSRPRRLPSGYGCSNPRDGCRGTTSRLSRRKLLTP